MHPVCVHAGVCALTPGRVQQGLCELPGPSSAPAVRGSRVQQCDAHVGRGWQRRGQRAGRLFAAVPSPLQVVGQKQGLLCVGVWVCGCLQVCVSERAREQAIEGLCSNGLTGAWDVTHSKQKRRAHRCISRPRAPPLHTILQRDTPRIHMRAGTVHAALWFATDALQWLQ